MNCFGTPDKVNQSYPSQIFSRKHLTTAWFISLGPALTVYRLTFYHTITWWDTAEYATAAICLCNPHPPGSLLLTLAG